MCWSNYFFSLKWEAFQHLFSLITSVIAQDVFQAMNTLIIGQVLSFGDQRQQHWQVLIDRWSVIIRCVDETFDGREVQVFRLWPQAHLQEMRSLLHNRRYHAIRLYSCLIWIKKYAKERGNKVLEKQNVKLVFCLLTFVGSVSSRPLISRRRREYHRHGLCQRASPQDNNLQLTGDLPSIS